MCGNLYFAIRLCNFYYQIFRIIGTASSMFFAYPLCLAVSCAPGNYQTVREGGRVFNGRGYKERYPVCRPCPMGTYADGIGNSRCRPCPAHHRTRSAGSSRREDCFSEFYYNKLKEPELALSRSWGHNIGDLVSSKLLECKLKVKFVFYFS